MNILKSIMLGWVIIFVVAGTIIFVINVFDPRFIIIFMLMILASIFAYRIGDTILTRKEKIYPQCYIP